MQPLAERVLEQIQQGKLSPEERKALAAALRGQRAGHPSPNAKWPNTLAFLADLVTWASNLPAEDLPPREGDAATNFGCTTRTIGRWLERAHVDGWEGFLRHFTLAFGKQNQDRDADGELVLTIWPELHTIRSVNAAARRVSGFTNDELIDAPYEAMLRRGEPPLHSRDEQLELLRRVHEQIRNGPPGAEFESETYWITKSRERIDLRLRLTFDHNAEVWVMHLNVVAQPKAETLCGLGALAAASLFVGYCTCHWLDFVVDGKFDHLRLWLGGSPFV